MKYIISILLLVMMGCGFIPGEDLFGDPSDITSSDLPPASKFSCNDIRDLDPQVCIDFNYTPDTKLGEDGIFEIVDGRLVGHGPDAGEDESLMTHLILPEFTGKDLHISLETTSMQRVDKVLLLRSVDSSNRLQLNFRALTGDGDYGDLIVQETRDGVFTLLTDPGEIPIGHELGETIKIEVWLINKYLRVRVNDEVVVSRDFNIAMVTGRMGVGVIDHSLTVFDDLVIY